MAGAHARAAGTLRQGRHRSAHGGFKSAWCPSWAGEAPGSAGSAWEATAVTTLKSVTIYLTPACNRPAIGKEFWVASLWPTVRRRRSSPPGVLGGRTRQLSIPGSGASCTLPFGLRLTEADPEAVQRHRNVLVPFGAGDVSGSLRNSPLGAMPKQRAASGSHPFMPSCAVCDDRSPSGRPAP